MIRSLAAFGVALFVLLWPIPVINSDSRHYLYAAQSLLAGEGWRNDPDAPFANGVFYSEWSPLYPVILAGFEALGVDPVVGARWLNAACYAGVVALVLSRVHRARLIALLALFSFPMWLVFLSIRTEGIYTLLVLLYVLWLPAPRRFVGVTLVTTIALLLRYAGVFLVGFGVLYFLLQRQIRQAVVFALLPTAAIAGWMIRNAALVGSPFGYREGARYPAAASVQSTLETLALFAPVIAAPVALEKAGRWILDSWRRSRSRSSLSRSQ